MSRTDLKHRTRALFDVCCCRLCGGRHPWCAKSFTAIAVGTGAKKEKEPQQVSPSSLGGEEIGRTGGGSNGGRGSGGDGTLDAERLRPALAGLSMDRRAMRKKCPTRKNPSLTPKVQR